MCPWATLHFGGCSSHKNGLTMAQKCARTYRPGTKGVGPRTEEGVGVVLAPSSPVLCHKKGGGVFNRAPLQARWGMHRAHRTVHGCFASLVMPPFFHRYIAEGVDAQRNGFGADVAKVAFPPPWALTNNG